MLTTLELKFVEFKANDPNIKKTLKELEKEGWEVQLISMARAKTKRFKLKRLQKNQKAV